MPGISSVAGKTSSLSPVRKRLYTIITGGTSSYDATYKYITFTISQTMTVIGPPIDFGYNAISGGGSSGSNFTYGSWYDYEYGYRAQYGGPRGAAGGMFRSGSTISFNGNCVVQIGAGAAGGGANGGTTSFNINNNSQFLTLNGGRSNGSNDDYSFGGVQEYGYAGVINNFTVPKFYSNGGGAGAGGAGSSATGYNGGDAGVGSAPGLSFDGLSYGGGSPGMAGEWEGGYMWFLDSYTGTTRGLMGNSNGVAGGAGTSSATSSGGNALENRGGAGGTGWTGGGNGGSGKVVFRCLRSLVGE